MAAAPAARRTSQPSRGGFSRGAYRGAQEASTALVRSIGVKSDPGPASGEASIPRQRDFPQPGGKAAAPVSERDVSNRPTTAFAPTRREEERRVRCSFYRAPYSASKRRCDTPMNGRGGKLLCAGSGIWIEVRYCMKYTREPTVLRSLVRLHAIAVFCLSFAYGACARQNQSPGSTSSRRSLGRS